MSGAMDGQVMVCHILARMHMYSTYFDEFF